MTKFLEDLRGLTASLVQGRVDPGGHDRTADAERIDRIAAMEQLKSALCAAQADLAVGLDASVRSQHAATGVIAAHRGRGVASQVALARQVSPHRGQVLLGFAKDLAIGLPHTRQALREGVLDEYAAMIIARESGCLDVEDRARLDEELCAPDANGARKVDGLGPQKLAGRVRRRVEEVDAAAVVRRRSKAESERHVSVRPAPDAMAYLTGMLPMGQAVAAYAALLKEADRLRGEGDERSRGQVMADLMVQRLTGQASAEGVPVTVDLIMSDASLLGAGQEPAIIPGWGSVPAQIAREMVARATESMQAWVRRLYADPTGNLVAQSTTQRLATDGIAAFLNVRDQGLCRTPWCDAPVRHVDHVVTAADGGPTDRENTQGLCETCNYTKEAPGWHQSVVDDPLNRHTVQTTTPTGHHHRSRAPAPPTPARPAEPVAAAVRNDLAWPLEQLVYAA